MVVRNSELPEGEYWIYLRKSRKDIEAEARGEGETLAKHRAALFKLAKDRNVNVTKVFPETESGETIIHRPEMIKMLREMEVDPPKGILVMDYDRLGRGDKIDQGMIERAFKENHVLVITPSEVMDLNSESGEFNAEVKGFLARMELRQITKRMQGGRNRSAESGNYIAARPPFGYTIINTDKGDRTLAPHADQADVVKLIFEWYTDGMNGQDMGSTKIAAQLGQMSVPTYKENTEWNFNVILQILHNPVYIGRIQWKKTERKKTADKDKYRKRATEEVIDVEGKHEPIIDAEVFHKAQEKLKENWSLPIKEKVKMVNPFAGLIKCGFCSRSMIYKNYPRRDMSTLVCNNLHCDCRSSRFDLVETRILEGLEVVLKDYNVSLKKKDKKPSVSRNVLEQSLKSANTELDQFQAQKLNAHNLVERGIYDDETFLLRSKEIADSIKDVSERLEKIKLDIIIQTEKEKTKNEVIPRIKKVLDSYHKTKDVGQKNKLMRSIVKEIVYTKSKEQTLDNFNLHIVPREA